MKVLIIFGVEINSNWLLFPKSTHCCQLYLGKFVMGNLKSNTICSKIKKKLKLKGSLSYLGNFVLWKSSFILIYQEYFVDQSPNNMFHRAKIVRTTFLLPLLNYKTTQLQNFKIDLDLKNKSNFLPGIEN